MRKVYVVIEDWADNGISDSLSSNIFSSFEKAMAYYKSKLYAKDTKELTDSIISNNDVLAECMDCSENSFECWEDGAWSDNHYSIRINTLFLDDSFDINETEKVVYD